MKHIADFQTTNSLMLYHCHNPFLPNRAGDTKNQTPLKLLSADSGPFWAHTGLVADKASYQSDRQQLRLQAQKSEEKVLATLSYFSRIFCMVRNSQYSTEYLKLQYAGLPKAGRQWFHSSEG